MQKLNLPKAELLIREVDNLNQIFDSVRRRWVTCTPEEWVRQNIIAYMINHRGYPAGLISVEHSFEFAGGKKFRADIVVFDKSLTPILVVECKAPTKKLSRETMEQICNYNINLKANYLVVTNGINHFAFKTTDHKAYSHLGELPEYRAIISPK